MKLQKKFSLISAFSILCGVFLLYQVYYTINATSSLPQELSQIQNSIHNLSYRAISSYAIQTELWKAAYYSSKNDEVALQDIKNNLNDILKNYPENLLPEDKIDLSLELDRHIQVSSNIFKNALDKTQTLITELDNPNFTKELNSLNELFLKVDQLNDSIYYQLIDFDNKLRKDTRNTIRQTLRSFLIVSILVITVITTITVISYFTFFVPLEKIINVMHYVEQNGWKNEIPFINRSDEVGDIARALEIFRYHSLEKITLEENAKKNEIQLQLQRKEHLLAFANSLEKSIKEIADTVAQTAVKIDKTAKELSSQANYVQDETNQLSETSLETNNNIQQVSEFTKEFNEAANKITAQVSSALNYSDTTSKQADNINNLVLDLEGKATEISSVLDIINHITSQIELLSLNATIEAARAGEYGKGFSVVASEIKELATQTNKATEQVDKQIHDIQNSTKKAVSAIKEITGAVKTINQTSASISSAVEEQNLATKNIADKVINVASKSEINNSSIKKVASYSNTSKELAIHMLNDAQELTQQSKVLQKELDNFLGSLRNN